MSLWGENHRPQATSKLLVETDRAIVTEWRFAPGAETGWHRHAHDYVVVVLTTGKLMQETANGVIVTELAAGRASARNVGVRHNVVKPNRFQSEVEGQALPFAWPDFKNFSLLYQRFCASNILRQLMFRPEIMNTPQ